MAGRGAGSARAAPGAAPCGPRGTSPRRRSAPGRPASRPAPPRPPAGARRSPRGRPRPPRAPRGRGCRRSRRSGPRRARTGASASASAPGRAVALHGEEVAGQQHEVGLVVEQLVDAAAQALDRRPGPRCGSVICTMRSGAPASAVRRARQPRRSTGQARQRLGLGAAERDAHDLRGAAGARSRPRGRSPRSAARSSQWSAASGPRGIARPEAEPHGASASRNGQRERAERDEGLRRDARPPSGTRASAAARARATRSGRRSPRARTRRPSRSRARATGPSQRLQPHPEYDAGGEGEREHDRREDPVGCGPAQRAAQSGMPMPTASASAGSSQAGGEISDMETREDRQAKRVSAVTEADRTCGVASKTKARPPNGHRSVHPSSPLPLARCACASAAARRSRPASTVRGASPGSRACGPTASAASSWSSWRAASARTRRSRVIEGEDGARTLAEIARPDGRCLLRRRRRSTPT